MAKLTKRMVDTVESRDKDYPIWDDELRLPVCACSRPANAATLSSTEPLDWFTRRVLAWRVSITLEAGFCIEAVAEALARPGAPEIFDTDQGSQFTSTDVIKVLASRKIRISMDAKGAWRDNVFVERLWRTIKYEDVRLQACASVSHARAGIGRHPGICNSRRPNASLDGKTPDQAYFSPPMPEARRHNRGGNPLANARSLFRQTEPLLFGAPGSSRSRSSIALSRGLLSRVMRSPLGPVAVSCRSRFSFKPPSVRKRRGFSIPMLSVGVAGYRTH
ncbi:putative transposase [Citreicella sp. 357]|nr:putative transposase [Citreicella sp. 357]